MHLKISKCLSVTICPFQTLCTSSPPSSKGHHCPVPQQMSTSPPGTDHPVETPCCVCTLTAAGTLLRHWHGQVPHMAPRELGGDLAPRQPCAVVPGCVQAALVAHGDPLRLVQARLGLPLSNAWQRPTRVTVPHLVPRHLPQPHYRLSCFFGTPSQADAFFA